ncbi:unnamed protein product [Trichogramma brassicae]|uniref:Uncharacterized protein n=1 Tax=Trichogramma brassicae TaxID=86971 RepID=A0A6H5IIS8_9HYME|nr:unnamed protein product [Trichogramma brassicae]
MLIMIKTKIDKRKKLTKSRRSSWYQRWGRRVTLTVQRRKQATGKWLVVHKGTTANCVLLNEKENLKQKKLRHRRALNGRAVRRPATFAS